MQQTSREYTSPPTHTHINNQGHSGKEENLKLYNKHVKHALKVEQISY